MAFFEYHFDTNTLILVSFTYQNLFDVRVVYWIDSNEITPYYFGPNQSGWKDVLDTDKFMSLYTKIINEIHKDYTTYEIQQIALKIKKEAEDEICYYCDHCKEGITCLQQEENPCITGDGGETWYCGDCHNFCKNEDEEDEDED
jgi:hypothetical protein